MILKLISCEVFYREMCYALSRSPHQVDIEFLPKGLHDIGAVPMRERIQERIDATDSTRYDAILLGYGLCNNGIAGLVAGRIPIVVPRAHDCITLFLGDKEQYLRYFTENPGVYFKTSGWIERGTTGSEFEELSIQRKTGLDLTLADLINKYGEDNGMYLFEEFTRYKDRYRTLTYIEMGVEPDDRFEQRARKDAEVAGWAFGKVKGDMSLIQRFVDGVWDDSEFLVVRSGHRVVATYHGGVITSEPLERPE
jgi:hypothetical protein